MESNDKTPETPTIPTRSPGPRAQSTNSPYRQTPIMQDFPPLHDNARFCITPESMGLERRSDTPTLGHEEQTTPKAEIKSYERQFTTGIKKGQPLQSTQSNLYTSYKQENYPQSKLLPALSPSAPISLQSNLYNSTKAQNVQQQRANSPPRFDIQQQQQTLTFNKPLARRLDSEQPSTSTAIYSEQLNMASALPLSPTEYIPQCSHPSHASLQNATSPLEIPTTYFEQHLKKYRSGSDQVVGNTSEMNGHLNTVFLKRLQDIDTKAYGNVNLKLVTYQEWVKMLLNVNEHLITNIEELESEVVERLEMVQRKVNTNCRHSQGNELMKCRKDIDTLIKIIQNAYESGNLDMQGVNFETITIAQVFGWTEQQVDTMNAEKGVVLEPRNSTDGGESMHKNKLLSNMKALAFEVAEKHDEVRELKRQVACLEDEIQKAQKKIHFKEDVIKELRNDLKCAHNKLNPRDSLETSLVMTSVHLEPQTSRSADTELSECKTLTDDNVSEFEVLSQTVNEENEKISYLKELLSELFTINKKLNEDNKQKMEEKCKSLTMFFQELESQKAAAYRRLEFIRHHLTDLESECVNDCDSGFHSKCAYDQDVKILDSVRKRLHKLNDTILEQKKTINKLNMENKVLSARLQSESNISQRNSQTLKEVADLLSGMIGQQFSYTDIYDSNKSEINPFCEVIGEIKRGYQDREIQLLRTVEENNKNIQELTLTLLNNEKSFGEQRTRLNIIDLEHLNQMTLPPPTTPPPPIPTTASTSATTLLTGQEHDKTTSTALQGLIQK